MQQYLRFFFNYKMSTPDQNQNSKTEQSTKITTINYVVKIRMPIFSSRDLYQIEKEYVMVNMYFKQVKKNRIITSFFK